MQSDIRKDGPIIDLEEDFEDILLLCLYWTYANIPAKAIESRFLVNKFFSETINQFKCKVNAEVEWTEGFIIAQRGPLTTCLDKLEELGYAQIDQKLVKTRYLNGIDIRERLEIRITERGLDHVKRTLNPNFKKMKIYKDLMSVIPKAYTQAKNRPKVTAKRGKRRLRDAGVPVIPSKGTWVVFGSQELEYPLIESLIEKKFYVLCVDSLQLDENVVCEKFMNSHLLSHFRYIYRKDKWTVLENFPKFISKQNVPEVKGVIFLEPPPFNYLEKLNGQDFRTIPSLQFARIAYFIRDALKFVGNKITNDQIALVPTFYASEVKDVREKLDEWGRAVVRPIYKTTKENGKNIFIIDKKDINKDIFKVEDIISYFKKNLFSETFCLQRYIEGDEILVTLNNFAKDVFSPFIDHPLMSTGIYTVELIRSKDGKYYFYGELDWHIEDVQYMATYYSFATVYYDCLASAINGLQMPTIPKTERTIYSSHSIQAYQKGLFESICEYSKNSQIRVKKLRYKIRNPSDKLAWISIPEDERKLEALVHESLLSWGFEK